MNKFINLIVPLIFFLVLCVALPITTYRAFSGLGLCIALAILATTMFGMFCFIGSQSPRANRVAAWIEHPIGLNKDVKAGLFAAAVFTIGAIIHLALLFITFFFLLVGKT